MMGVVEEAFDDILQDFACACVGFPAVGVDGVECSGFCDEGESAEVVDGDVAVGVFVVFERGKGFGVMLFFDVLHGGPHGVFRIRGGHCVGSEWWLFGASEYKCGESHQSLFAEGSSIHHAHEGITVYICHDTFCYNALHNLFKR